MSLPSRTPVTDGGSIVKRVPSRAISPLLVPAIIAQITGTSALILIAISASGLVLTNVMATTATGNDARPEMCRSVRSTFGPKKQTCSTSFGMSALTRSGHSERQSPLSALTGHHAGASEASASDPKRKPFPQRPGLRTNAPPVALLRQ